MDELTISLIVFAVVVSATAFGVVLNRVVPPHHLSNESKEIIHLGIGVIVTLTALVLGLLVASAKSSFDTKSDEIRHSSVKLIEVDRLLRQLGQKARHRARSCAAGSTIMPRRSGRPRAAVFR